MTVWFFDLPLMAKKLSMHGNEKGSWQKICYEEFNLFYTNISKFNKICFFAKFINLLHLKVWHIGH